MTLMYQVYARIGAPDCVECGGRCNASGYAFWTAAQANEPTDIEITLWHCVNRKCRQLERSIRKQTVSAR